MMSPAPSIDDDISQAHESMLDDLASLMVSLALAISALILFRRTGVTNFDIVSDRFF
jgi:hypothetical protein